MKNRELNELLQAIDACGKLTGVKLAYGLDKNKKLIMRELESLQEAIKPNEEFIEYDKKRIEACEKYCEKGKDGKAKRVNNSYSFLDEGKKKFDKEMEKLNKENSKTVEAREKQIKEFNELMEKESSYTPFMIDFESVPEDIEVATFGNISTLVNKSKK